jgi:hypothetical protein
MALRHAVLLVGAVGGILAATGCGGSAASLPDIRSSCKAAWNAPGNEANRKAVAASGGGAAWEIEVSRWTGIGDPLDPQTDPVTQEGCAYTFFTSERWMSMSGAWDETGALHWQSEIEQGARTPGQRSFTPTATVAADGTIR